MSATAPLVSLVAATQRAAPYHEFMAAPAATYRRRTDVRAECLSFGIGLIHRGGNFRSNQI